MTPNICAWAAENPRTHLG